MYAAVDLGSNSFRMHIGIRDGDTIRIVKTARDPIRLGAGLDRKGNLTEQAMQTALDSLTRFRQTLSAYPLDAVRVVATNTLRIAKNASVFLPAAESAIGYPIEIISGEEEGRLIYMGVASTLAAPEEKRLVIDIGGGSTELIRGKGHEIEEVESFSIGTVGHSLSFFGGGKIDAASFDAAVLSARSNFEDGTAKFLPQNWTNAYGSSGTIRALGDAIAKNALGDGRLTIKGLQALRQRLIECGRVDNINLYGMKPDRATIIMGGLAILLGIMQELGIKSVTPIEAGLRLGVLWDLQLRATPRDRREVSVRSFVQRFHADEKRATRVAEIAGVLYAQLKPNTEGYTRYLFWSGLLHEVGMVVSHSSYHKHGAYLIENADLPGFTTREQRIVSKLVLGQKGNLRKLNGWLADMDFAKAVLAMRLAVMLMHSHIDVLLDEIKVRMKSRIELDIRRDWLSDHPTLAYWIDKERGWWGEAGIEFLIRENS
jgi:exopolyphosphatase/guanosine-5'-triphosphate,3'-diphosphate pyrophosphatase